MLFKPLRIERTTLVVLASLAAVAVSALIPLLLLDFLTVDNLTTLVLGLGLTIWIARDVSRGTFILVGLLVAGGVALIFSGSILARSYRVIIMITFALLLFHALRRDKLSDLLCPIWPDLAIIGLFLVATISYLYLMNAPRASSTWGQLLRALMLYVIITRTLRQFGDFVRAYRAGSIAAVVLVLVVVLQRNGLLDSFGANNGRATGLGSDANTVGLICAATLPWFVWMTRYDRGIWRLWGIAALVANLTTLSLTFSRGAMLSAVLALLLCLAFSRQRLRDALIYGFAALGIMLTLNVLNFTSWDVWAERVAVLGTFFSGDATTSSDESVSYRAHAAQVGWEIFLDNWPTGVGIGQAMRSMHMETGENLKPHNTYLDIMIDMGLIGALFYLAMFGIPLLMLLRAAYLLRENAAFQELNLVMITSILVMLFGFFTLSLGYENQVFLFAGLGAALAHAASQAARQQRSAQLPQQHYRALAVQQRSRSSRSV